MSFPGWGQAFVLLVALALFAEPLGAYLARVFEGEPIVLGRALGWLERLVYRTCGVPLGTEEREMKWTAYAAAMLLFNAVGVATVYAALRLQGHLPLNPDAMAEGRGKAQSGRLAPQGTRGIQAKQISEPRRDVSPSLVVASRLRKGDYVLCEAGDQSLA